MMLRINAGRMIGTIICLMGLLLPILNSPLVAQSDSTENEPESNYIFFTGHLNFDRVPDTLKGYVSHDLQYVPSMICWGSTDTTASQRKKSGNQTRIKLPNWQNLLISCAVEDVNLDSLPDIIFYLRGISDDTTKTRKQFRALVLFGQNGLDSIKKISLGSISDGFQQTPFFAMDLRKGVELDKAAKRDPTRKESYVLKKVYRNVNSDSTRDTSRSVTHIGETSGVASAIVSIYPNPAAQAANIEIKQLPPGNYRVVLYSVNGMQYHSQEIEVDASGEVLRHLRLEGVPTGYYVVHMFSTAERVGSYPVIVVQ